MTAEDEAPPADELEVMRLIAEGLDDRAIARQLGVATITVRRRAYSFRRRVGAANRVQAAVIAVRKGWI